MRWSSLAVAAYSLATSALALDPVEVYGNKFFNKDGSQFFLKGIAYQLNPGDPLIDTDQCNKDIDLMKTLGTNAIRVYHVNSTANHDGCMKAFADAGIYLLVDLDTFDTYIGPDTLYWTKNQYDRYAQVMDTFHKYDNVLGFYIANERIAAKTDSNVAPYFKAATRDMKAYRDSKGYRKIPIGYSAADIKELRPQLQDYLTCGGNASETVDFYSVNSYSWCGKSDYEISTYDKLQAYAKDFPVPIFFSETGCIIPSPRNWDDQDAIFSDPMVNVWSGAIVYEWIQEENNYGIVTYAGEGLGTPSPRNPDFENLKNKWTNIHPQGVKKADYKPNVSTRACPTPTAGSTWEIDGDVKIPALGASMEGGATTVPAATGIPSGTQTLTLKSTPTGSGDKGGSDKGGSDKDGNGKGDKKGGDKDSAASLDKQVTIFGMSLAGVVLATALLL